MSRSLCSVDIEAQWAEIIDRVVEKNKTKPGSLIQMLGEIQEEIGYLPEIVQAYLAEKIGIPLSEIYGVVTFYAFFNTEPIGEHKISVCLGTACYVKGSGNILAEFEKLLDVKAGETTADRKFTLEACRCLGACGLAPVLTVDDKVHGSQNIAGVPRLIEMYCKE